VPGTDRGQGPAAASDGHGAGEHAEAEAPRAEAAELRRRTAGKPKLELGHTWTRSSSALPERRPALDRLSGQRANELSTARCQAGDPGLFAPKRRRDRLSRSGRHHQPGTEQPLAYRSAVLRAAVPRWLTTLCDQWQTQMRLQCPAERQALADGNPLRVIADPASRRNHAQREADDASPASPSGRQLFNDACSRRCPGCHLRSGDGARCSLIPPKTTVR
jgi:hypothetical protein